MQRITALTIVASLAGCAMTPNQVAETEAMAKTTVKADIATLAPCLQDGLENITGPWTASTLKDRDGKGAAFRLHGHNDTGTMAVARARRIGERTEISVHVSTSIFPRQPLADNIKALAEGCDTR
jgi:hypothetical protein